jgi:NAD+ synthase (glutamine-hydrolysing)
MQAVIVMFVTMCAGAVSKGDLRRFLHWAVEHLGYTALIEVEKAAPTAELEPIREGFAPQTDEQA